MTQEKPVVSHITLGWHDRVLIIIICVGVAAFLWGVQELRIQRVEDRVWEGFSIQAQLETIRLNHYRLLHSHCKRFGDDHACDYTP